MPKTGQERDSGRYHLDRNCGTAFIGLAVPRYATGHNKYDTALDHDIDFVEKRAARLPLIAKVLKGELKSRVYRMSHRRGKRASVRRVLTVIEMEHQYYVVVLDEVKGIYKIRTAFPATKNYYEQCIRGQGTNAGAWG